jgi:hypothetical protein
MGKTKLEYTRKQSLKATLSQALTDQTIVWLKPNEIAKKKNPPILDGTSLSAISKNAQLFKDA